MRYHIWDRENGKLLGVCNYKQTAYDFRAIEAEKTGKPKSAFRISYEIPEYAALKAARQMAAPSTDAALKRVAKELEK